MSCLRPEDRPYWRPEPVVLDRSGEWVEAWTRTVEGAEYVLRVSTRRRQLNALVVGGGAHPQVEVAVNGHAGVEVIATVNAPLGQVTRITLPAVLAGHELRVRVKGDRGTTFTFDVGWRPW
ncbi:MAG: hypothetical protein H6701_05460 [Myxococcales bacterium]|nr:hypothetical protein [Myxococcales bacterium]